MAPADYEELEKEFLKDLDKMEGDLKERILRMAKELVQHGMKENEVSAAICKMVKGRKNPTDAYVRMILPKKYKHGEKAHKTMKGKPLEEIKKETQEKNKRLEEAKILLTNDGKQVSDKELPKDFFEKPLSNSEIFRNQVKKIAELEVENKRKDMLLNKELPIVKEITSNGIDLFQQKPLYYKGTAASVKKQLYEGLKDNNPDHQYAVMVTRLADKVTGVVKSGSTKTVPV